MVTRWGMSEKLGPVSYKLSDEDPFLGREMHEQRQFSEHTMEVIDSEVSALLHDAESRANNLLVEYRDELESLTARLVAEEELSEVQIADTIGPSVHPTPEADPEEALPSPPDNPTKPGAVAGDSDALEGSALEESGAIASQQINESNSDDDEVPGGNY